MRLYYLNWIRCHYAVGILTCLWEHWNQWKYRWSTWKAIIGAETVALSEFSQNLFGQWPCILSPESCLQSHKCNSWLPEEDISHFVDRWSLVLELITGRHKSNFVFQSRFSPFLIWKWERSSLSGLFITNKIVLILDSPLQLSSF